MFDGACDGDELACNDDSGTEPGPSETSAYVAAGDDVVIVLGGYEGATGTYYLTID